MCDTVGKILKAGEHAIFAKNSDREQDEAQVVQYIPAKNYKFKKLKTTYLEIEQVAHTFAILISRPVWMWGAEMGVNEHGVCIGNEALYFKNYNNPETGLLGMDLVRLALERASTALQAVNAIINLLIKYNQGGICSTKNKDKYDNSFLIMDINECYILETKNNAWLYKKVDMGVISNCPCIETADAFNISSTLLAEKQLKENPSGIERRKQMLKPAKKMKSVFDAFKILRIHGKKQKSSICMHGEYTTTSSMVVELKKNEQPKIYFTACSNPCQALFKFYKFGEQIAKPIVNEQNLDKEYWNKFCLDEPKTAKFEKERDKLEKHIVKSNASLTDSVELENILFEKFD